MTWKSITSTLIISMILFFGIVSMGMKYHWVNKFKSNDKQNISLEIPQQAETTLINDTQLPQYPTSHTLDFQPVVLKHDQNNQHSFFSTMTKQQVIDYCTAQFQKSSQPHQEMTLAVGDCVVTRYQDPYQEIHGNVKDEMSLR